MPIYKIAWTEAHIVTVDAENEKEAKEKLKDKEIIDEHKERIGALDVYPEDDI
jgi:hypothetical protein